MRNVFLFVEEKNFWGFLNYQFSISILWSDPQFLDIIKEVSNHSLTVLSVTQPWIVIFKQRLVPCGRWRWNLMRFWFSSGQLGDSARRRIRDRVPRAIFELRFWYGIINLVFSLHTADFTSRCSGSMVSLPRLNFSTVIWLNYSQHGIGLLWSLLVWNIHQMKKARARSDFCGEMSQGYFKWLWKDLVARKKWHIRGSGRGESLLWRSTAIPVIIFK